MSFVHPGAYCFMWFMLVLLTILSAAGVGNAQSDLDRMVETERSFARAAATVGIKDAFLQYMSDDALAFVPQKVSAKQYWSGRSSPAGLLIWAPNFADISSNGILGYTTGNWEFRPKGKEDKPDAFGHFVTLWLRQPSGHFKWVLDVAVDHPRPERFVTGIDGELPPVRSADKRAPASDFANRFFEMAMRSGLKKAYNEFAAEDVRFYREGVFPARGKKQLLSTAGKDKRAFNVAKRSVFFEADDLAYVTNTYTFGSPERGVVENGNFLQIWKLRDGRWQIVLDLFKPVPAQQN